MFKLLYRCLNYYGIDGIHLFYQLKYSKDILIQLPGYIHPFRLRRNSTDEQIFYQIYFNKCYDYDFAIKPKVILDLGAHIGLASIFFAEKFKEATIISVEPNKKNFETLKSNCKAYSNIIPINGAIFKKSIKLSEIESKTDFSGHQFVSAHHKGPNSPDTFTIDQIIERHNLKCIDILKIDIEGSEKDLFESGYENWIEKTNSIFIEIHDHLRPGTSKNVFRAISKYDFQLEIKGENLLFVKVL